MKYCQGPKCHEYKTKDRIRGSKGDKHYETRKRSEFYYLNGNACSMQCQGDWFRVYGSRALDHFGRTTQPKVLTADNAWRKTYDWNARVNGERYQHYVYNHLTEERRPITEQQYDSENTITDDGRLAI